MRKTLASITSTGAAPWKFLLLAATLLFSYAIPVNADDHEESAPTDEVVTEEFNISSEIKSLQESLVSADEEIGRAHV